MRLCFVLCFSWLLAADDAHQRVVVRTDMNQVLKESQERARKEQEASRKPNPRAAKQRGKVKLPKPATIQNVPKADKMIAKANSKQRRPRWGGK